MTLTRRIDLTKTRGKDARLLLGREWLVTNGLGGYASGTISGCENWRYHGLLIAALPAPFGRQVMLNHVSEYLVCADGTRHQIGGEEPALPENGQEVGHYLTEFRLENGLPVWRYQIGEIKLEKRVLFLYGQNTVHLSYWLLSDQEQVRLELRPAIHFRGHEQPVDHTAVEDYRLEVTGEHYEITAPNMLPRLRMVMRGDQARFTYDGGSRREIFYQKEADRGYASRGTLWSPGCFSIQLHPQRSATLIASTEWWSIMLALRPEEALGFYHDRHRMLIDKA
ncbi:MAG TPA: glycogen debranching enzyme N-terminal domain-containing protein, partial [Clostridia bacterium]|nr:glycogen debranching enzyme N-terminal domain-containing protein [Clostridia bacterium]